MNKLQKDDLGNACINWWEVGGLDDSSLIQCIDTDVEGVISSLGTEILEKNLTIPSSLALKVIYGLTQEMFISKSLLESFFNCLDQAKAFENTEKEEFLEESSFRVLSEIMESTCEIVKSTPISIYRKILGISSTDFLNSLTREEALGKLFTISQNDNLAAEIYKRIDDVREAGLDPSKYLSQDLVKHARKHNPLLVPYASKVCANRISNSDSRKRFQEFISDFYKMRSCHEESKIKRKMELWLNNEVLVKCNKNPHILKIFDDEIDVQTLKYVCSFFGSSEKLTSKSLETFYKCHKKGTEENSLWEKLKKKGLLKDNQSQLVLLLLNFGIKPSVIERLLKYFQSFKSTCLAEQFKILMVLLTEEKNLSKDDKKYLLNLILDEPKKKEREGKTFLNKLSEARKNQKLLISSLYGILTFNKARELKPILRSSDIKEYINTSWVYIAHAFLSKSLDANSLKLFLSNFQYSERAPGALTTYFLSLLKLSASSSDVSSQRENLVNSLGKFASGVMDGTFPEIRYEFKESEHLQAVFSSNPELLKQWRIPLSFEVKTPTSSTPIDVNVLREKISEYIHEDQNIDYPSLCKFIQGECTSELALADLSKRQSENKEQIKKAAKNSDDSKKLREKSQQMKNEYRYLQLVTTSLSENKLNEHLKCLVKTLPDGSFKNYLNDLLTTLSEKNTSLIVRDTDDWQDLLLLGTEVDGSCQIIFSSDDLNRALMAYLLDGKIRPIVIKNNEEVILARGVLRILQDSNKNPVLVLSKPYFRGPQSDKMQNAILEGAKEKARQMGLPLFTNYEGYEAASIPVPDTNLSCGFFRLRLAI